MVGLLAWEVMEGESVGWKRRRERVWVEWGRLRMGGKREGTGAGESEAVGILGRRQVEDLFVSRYARASGSKFELVTTSV